MAQDMQSIRQTIFQAGTIDSKHTVCFLDVSVQNSKITLEDVEELSTDAGAYGQYETYSEDYERSHILHNRLLLRCWIPPHVLGHACRCN